MDDHDAGSFSAAFLFGAIAGVLIGFLVAPAPGKKVRALLRDRAREAAAAAASVARKAAPREE
jgi:gas vesicle protein